MIRWLIGLAALLFVVWLVLSVAGAVFHGLIHLLWVLIVICLVIGLWNVLTGRRTPTGTGGAA